MRSFESPRGWVCGLVPLALLACGAPDPEAGQDVAVVQEAVSCSSEYGGHAVDLGVLEPNPLFSSSASGINRHGTVVGLSNVHYSPELNPSRAFRWTPQTGMTALATLSGPSSWAEDVNDREQIVGSAEVAEYTPHAALWDADGAVHDLGTLGGRSSTAFAINNRGQVIGLADDESGNTRPFIWDERDGMVDFGTPAPDFIRPLGINDAGVVVGSWTRSGGSTVPFKWSKRSGLIALDIEGGIVGEASDINGRGDIVGYAVRDGVVVGMEWRGPRSSPVTLSTFEGGLQPWPQAINDRGVIAGWDWPQNENAMALVWTSPRHVEKLPLETFAIAYDLNERGQIAGVWNGHAFIWEPGKRHCKGSHAGVASEGGSASP